MGGGEEFFEEAADFVFDAVGEGAVAELVALAEGAGRREMV